MPEQEKLASRLVAHSFADKAFFCNSGAEANEGAVKIARKYFASKGQPEKRSEEHTSELQSLMRISYAVFCLKKKKNYAIQKYANNNHNEYQLQYQTTNIQITDNT